MKRQASLVRSWLILLLITVLIGTTSPIVSAQTQEEEGPYYSKTGHNVHELFYDYFRNSGGLERFGYPITEAYADPSGRWVQYFQKARLEWHPENADPNKIVVGLLGEELNKKQVPIPASQIPAAADPNCLYYSQTGHTVCNSFLKYFQAQGGVEVFGYPITEYIQENGMIVQYFQRALFEWHPSKPPGQRVLTARLGQIYYDWAGLDRDRLLPVDPISGSTRVIQLKARASVLSAIVSKGTAQTGYVYVYDQLGHPISGATVTLVVRFPNGSSASYTLPPTGATGTTFQSFPVTSVKPGQIVVMEFIVSSGSLIITTRTSYMMWYY